MPHSSPSRAALVLVLALACGCAQAQARPPARAPGQPQVVTLHKGQSVDLQALSWVDKCKSVLERFGSVDLVVGPPGLKFTIREEPVVPRREKCADKVPGGTLVLTAESVPARYSGLIQYRVTMLAKDARRQSMFNTQLEYVP